MPYDPQVSSDWTTVVLEADEIWQCREGQILVTADSLTTRTQGILLDGDENAGVKIASGKTVRYRKVGDATAVLARESFE